MQSSLQVIYKENPFKADLGMSTLYDRCVQYINVMTHHTLVFSGYFF